MEMEGRGAEHAGGSSAGSSASGEVSGEPVLAGEDEGASVVAESPHPDDEGRARKRARAPAAAPPRGPPWPPPPQPPQRPDDYVQPRYEGELNRDLVGSAGGILPVYTAGKRAAPRVGEQRSHLGFHLDGAEKAVIQDSVGTLLADHLCEFAVACRPFSAGSTVMDDVLIAYWRELGALVTAAWPTEPISGSSNVPERLERLARLAVHCAELGSQLSTELVRVFFPLYLR